MPGPRSASPIGRSLNRSPSRRVRPAKCLAELTTPALPRHPSSARRGIGVPVWACICQANRSANMSPVYLPI